MTVITQASLQIIKIAEVLVSCKVQVSAAPHRKLGKVVADQAKKHLVINHTTCPCAKGERGCVFCGSQIAIASMVS